MPVKEKYLLVFIFLFLISTRRFLRETLKIANAEDLNRLTSCSLVLLSHGFLSLGNSREAMNMVTPAMQLASKIPDVHVQLWASAILKGTYKKIIDLFSHKLCCFVLSILLSVCCTYCKDNTYYAVAAAAAVFCFLFSNKHLFGAKLPFYYSITSTIYYLNPAASTYRSDRIFLRTYDCDFYWRPKLSFVT